MGSGCVSRLDLDPGRQTRSSSEDSLRLRKTLGDVIGFLGVSFIMEIIPLRVLFPFYLCIILVRWSYFCIHSV